MSDSRPDTTRTLEPDGILEAPILAPSANRYAMSEYRVLEHAAARQPDRGISAVTPASNGERQALAGERAK
jgi:hypothetical protein